MTNSEALNPTGFEAAIEAAEEETRSGGDEQEQLAAAIIAYCAHHAATQGGPTFINNGSTAVDIGRRFARGTKQ